MGEFLESRLTEGVLGNCCEKIRDHLVHIIDNEQHVKTYVGQHEDWFAEPEFTGKYLDLCVKIYTSHGEKRALKNASAVVESILKNIRPDGYIGGLAPGHEFENFSVWNQMFTVMGLVSYYQATGYDGALEAGERCVSYIMNSFMKKGVDILDCLNNGTEHSSILFVISDLYKITKKQTYVEYMLYVINAFRNSDLNFLEFDDILNLKSKKGIEIMIILISILKYAEILNDANAIESVKKYWQQVHDTQIRNTGNATLDEVWTKNGNAAAMLDKEKKPNETCVAVGWIELSMYLFKLTGEAKYLDAVDKTLYNHILASISEDGSDFAYYQANYGKKITTTDDGMYKCCRYRGFTLFTYMEDMLFYEDEEYIVPLLYTNAVFKSEHIRISEKSEYPYGGRITFVVHTDRIESKKWKLRIPKDCLPAGLTVNGSPVRPVIHNGYVILDLSDKPHCEITLDLEPQMMIERGNIDGQEVAAFRYGQLLLALKDAEREIMIAGNRLELVPLESTGSEYVRFVGTGIKNKTECEIEFVDYASADGYQVWVPIAEEVL